MQKRLLVIEDPWLRTGFEPLLAAVGMEDLNIAKRTLLDPVSTDCDAVLFLLTDPLINVREFWTRGCALGDFYVRAGLPVFRHPRTLQAGRKSVFAARMQGAIQRRELSGVRVARCATWPPPLDFPWPCILREDDLHTSEPVLLTDPVSVTDTALAAKFARPIAVEYIDVRSDDGCYRKYRYFVAGAHGTRLHLQIASTWCVRGSGRLATPAQVREEVDFLEAQPTASEAELFLRVARVLELDVCAFDYSFDAAGNVVIWEVNPTPAIPRFFDRRHTKFWADLRVRDLASARAYELYARAVRETVDGFKASV